jgi:3-isopropylmalate/(R)-2-methylmalate dehydratase small subunit
MKVTGNVWKFPQDDINTDQIRRKIYAHLPLKEQATHCLEGLDAAFAANVKKGDIIVAGRNFGAGSSTPAHTAVMELGIAAIIAESFGRLFFRSSISAGLLVAPCPGILAFVNAGDRIELDAVSGEVKNLTTGKTLSSDPLPDFLREMVAMGGEKPYIRARLAVEARDAR